MIYSVKRPALSSFSPTGIRRGGRPVCLHKETKSGGLFVLDIEPAEAAPSTFGEPVLAMHLLLSMLG